MPSQVTKNLLKLVSSVSIDTSFPGFVEKFKEIGANLSSQTKPIIIAVDGLSASGKGTIGKIIAKHYNFQYLDTGLLYRAVAYRIFRSKKLAQLIRQLFCKKYKAQRP